MRTTLFGSRLKQARMAAGLSQQELAVLLKLKNQTSISQMERGIQLVDIAQAEQIADLLKVSPSWLAFGGE